MIQSYYMQSLPGFIRLGLSLNLDKSSIRFKSLGYIILTWLSVIISILSTMDYHGTKLPIRALYELLHFLGTLAIVPLTMMTRKDLSKLVFIILQPLYDFKTGSSLREEILATYTKKVNRAGKFFVFYLLMFLACFLLSFSPLLTLPYYSKNTPVNNLPLPVGEIPFYTDSYTVYILAYIISASAMCGEGIFNSCWLLILFIGIYKTKAQLQLLVDAINYLKEKALSRALRDDERDEAFMQSLQEGEDLLRNGDEIITEHQTDSQEANARGGSVCNSNPLKPGTYTLNRRQYLSNKERKQAARQFKIETKVPQEEIACLNECVKKHIEIIKFVGLFKVCFKYVLLIAFQTEAMLISVTFLQIVQMGKYDFWEMLIAVHVGLTCLFVLWVLNYSGQSIIDECDKLQFALYSLDWKRKPKSLVSSLRIMMTVSTRPLLLSVGGLYPLSMESFGKILSAAYTYINLLFSIQKGKNFSG